MKISCASFERFSVRTVCMVKIQIWHNLSWFNLLLDGKKYDLVRLGY